MAERIAKIDALGRLLIPKPIRVRLGLSAGCPVELVEEDRSLRLTACDEEVPVATRDGLPVLTGRPVGSLADAVESHRRARIRDMRWPRSSP